MIDQTVKSPSVSPESWYIVDVGMHVGSDSEYYAKRGFKVVAFEANPVLADEGKVRFSELGLDVDVRNFAIYDGPEETIDFHIHLSNSQWSSIKESLASRGEAGTTMVKVRTANLADQLRAIQDKIHMVKIDIEGFDYVALEQIASLDVMPQYISVENGGKWFLNLFAKMGYKKFKYSNQMYNAATTIPWKSPHGKRIEHKFDRHSSGAFGEDLPGRWLTLEEADNLSEAIDLARSKTKGDVWAQSIGWFDMHARLDA
jgi:FkbM family methyltransferase